MVSGLGQIRVLPTIRREMDSRTIRVNGEIGGPGRGDQTATVCRRRKSHCSTWDKHNFILMNNWESLELGWDKCVRAARVSVSWQHLDCFQLRIRAEPRLLPGSHSTLIIWGHNKTRFGEHLSLKTPHNLSFSFTFQAPSPELWTHSALHVAKEKSWRFFLNIYIYILDESRS